MARDSLTIAQAAVLTGLPESTLRYWERIGLFESIDRDPFSGHRRYTEGDIQVLHVLGNLRSVGMTVADMRRYLDGQRRGDEAAGAQKELFAAHARRVADEIAAREPRLRYLELKVPVLERTGNRRPRRSSRHRRSNPPTHQPRQPSTWKDTMTTTRATSRFDWHSTAADVVRGLDLSGRKALVTGAANGIGAETARALASAGAETIVAAPNLPAAHQFAAEIRASTDNDKVHVAALDLLDRASIDALAASVAGPLHILVNNAGVMAIPELRRSPESHEMQFTTNHLGHFCLTTALLPALRSANGARVVSVSSRAHLNSPVVFDDVDFHQRDYDPALAYAQSKTANVLFAVEAASRWADDAIEVNALHPGIILDSNLSRYYDPSALDEIRNSGRYTYKSIAQGAATSVFVANSPDLAGIVGRYFENSQEADPDNPGACGINAAGIAEHALDPSQARRL